MSTIIADGNVMSSIFLPPAQQQQQQQTTIGCFAITDFCVRGLGGGGGGEVDFFGGVFLK